MQRSEERNGTINELLESDQRVLDLLDSMDNYLTLVDSLSAALRQGWLEIASSRHSMGTSRVSSSSLDLKPHHASTKLQVNCTDSDLAPCFVLSKWTSTDDVEKFEEEAKLEEEDLVKKDSKSPRIPDKELREGLPDASKSPVTPDNHAQKERLKSLSMFGMLVSPKLRATQQSFETALETLVEIANIRAYLLHAYDQVKNDLKISKES